MKEGASTSIPTREEVLAFAKNKVASEAKDDSAAENTDGDNA
jgi:hypothetical protein